MMINGPKLAMRLEVVTIPVSDIERAKEFYLRLGWRLDADFTRGAHGEFRGLQFTPPGSESSIQFGRSVTSAPPGSAHNLFLVVSDLEAAREDILSRGVRVSEVFHFDDQQRPIMGPAPAHQSYGSFATFNDPDGNLWLLQEVTSRLPGRVDAQETTFGSESELSAALGRASRAHGEHEQRTGRPDMDWPNWYASYIAAEQHGKELPL